MNIIKGKIKRGIGESINTIKAQMPFFKQCFPEVAICKEATINILLEKPLVIITPDFISDPLPWHPALKIVKGGEIFRFLKIKLTVDGFAPCDAWIYEAQFSPYSANPFYIEVIAPQLNFTGMPSCQIEFLDKYNEGVVIINNESKPE